MAGPVLYSTNSWMAHNIASKYRNGTHFVWCSEHYDPAASAVGSPAAAIAPSSSPKTIYDALHRDCANEERHSALINGYKRTFRRLAKAWLSAGEIDKQGYDEVVTMVNAPSWRGWRPLLYVIPSSQVRDRLIRVPAARRAGHGDEFQIEDLQAHEFDVIEL